MKKTIQQCLATVGYRIERIRDPQYVTMDILDLVVRDHMTKARDFFFIEIGANDGILDDPVRRFVTQHHWRGILVEPVPSLFKSLCENYADETQLMFENAAIDSEDGTATIYGVRPNKVLPEWATLLASFDRDVLLSHREKLPGLESFVEPLIVPTLTFNSLLTKHRVQKIDLLLIDTEGYDFEILRMFDFDRMKPSIIQYEWVNLPKHSQADCLEFLASRGYKTAMVRQDVVAYQQPTHDVGGGQGQSARPMGSCSAPI